MHSSTILLLLSAFIGLSSGTIYWNNFASKRAVAVDNMVHKAQTQVNLILHAYRHHDAQLLYSLIPFGKEIDRYLKNHCNHTLTVEVQEADEIRGKMVVAVKLHEVSHGVAKHSRALLSFGPSNSSPTGYKISHGFICKNKCVVAMGYFEEK